MYKLEIENTVTHQVHTYNVEDINKGKKLYFQFDIDTLGLSDGEYNLTLFDEEENIVCVDLLKIGDFSVEALQYKKGENTYIVVN